MGQALRIVFFHSLTCSECRKVKRVLERILEPWGGRVRVEWKSTGDIQVFRELLLYDEHYCYGVRTKSPPVMFVGRRHLEGEKRIYRDLARVVREELAAGAVTYRPPAGPATRGDGDVPEEIVGGLRGFRIAALAWPNASPTGADPRPSWRRSGRQRRPTSPGSPRGRGAACPLAACGRRGGTCRSC